MQQKVGGGLGARPGLIIITKLAIKSHARSLYSQSAGAEPSELTCEYQYCTSLLSLGRDLIGNNTGVRSLVPGRRGVHKEAVVHLVGEPGRGSDRGPILEPDDGHRVGGCKGAVESRRAAFCDGNIRRWSSEFCRERREREV